ncbi:MAG: hypothetical protein IAF94_08225 [Pirellulaceae bacterium]|nr:hypothetical protein [Pirellulaceae bacterium]
MTGTLLSTSGNTKLPLLSPAEQKILPLLLRGDTEKGIAIKLERGDEP